MKKTLLILILALGLFLRTYKLGSFPSDFLWDEASLGYNAYSILHTGKDEYGSRLPIIFKSFGDYKPGLYIYTAIPFVAIFGLNEFSTRLPSAVAGTIAIYLLFLLVKKKNDNETLALICAAVLCINPWHLNFSRGSWELNLMLTELLGMIILLDSYLTKNKKRYGILSVVLFILTLITYQSAKFISPVLFFLYLFINQPSQPIKHILNKRSVALCLTIVGCIATFLAITFFSGSGGRLKAMSVFSYPRSSEERQILLNQDNGNKPIYTLFHSSPAYFARTVLERYFNHFSGRFLFVDGDWSNLRNGVIYHGVFYWMDLIFILIGLYYLFSKKRTPLDNFMLIWLIIAPIPSALSRDIISSIRSYTMVIPLVYIITNGIYWFVSSIQFPISLRPRLISPKWLYLISYISLVVVYCFSFFRYVDLYIIHNPILTARDRLVGYKEAVDYLTTNQINKDKIIFSDKYGQPYIFYLFYTAYSPARYQRQAHLTENPYGDVGHVDQLDNITFRPIYWPSDRGITNSLFIGTDEDLPLKDVTSEPDKFFVKKDIQYPDGKTAFRVIETY